MLLIWVLVGWVCLGCFILMLVPVDLQANYITGFVFTCVVLGCLLLLDISDCVLIYLVWCLLVLVLCGFICLVKCCLLLVW